MSRTLCYRIRKNQVFLISGISLGESGLGKSTLVNTLFSTELYPNKVVAEPSHETPKTVDIQSITADIEENGVRLRLNVVDTPGFGDFVNNEERYVHGMTMNKCL
jgi:septin 7